jgi:hypothetical protein
MGSKAKLGKHFRLVEAQSGKPILSQADFAWEILRRRADYQPGPVPVRRAIGAAGGRPVTLIECDPPPDRSWGLLFRGGS